VQRILRTKDYYAILGLEKNSSEKEVQKAYKKLALKLHPDKNKAPGAEEAFKKVSKAVQCLMNADQKEAYDRHGDEEHVHRGHQRRHQQDFMTPEDLFAAFFGGGPSPFHHHGGQQRQSGNQDEDGQGVQRAHLFQMLPVLLLVFLTLASNFASRDSGGRFSFTANNQYSVDRSTAALGVNYYVTPDFEHHYSDGTKQMAEFDRQVEIYYVRNLHSECDYQEKVMYKKVMIAKRRGNEEEVKKARNHPRPACKEIDKIKRKHPSIYRAALYMAGF
jgi:curved DNA-binding protein CbpA